MKTIQTRLLIPAIILVCSLFSFTCLSQTKQPIKEPAKKSLVKLNLISAVDIFVFPTIQLSYERKLSKRIAMAGEFGYQFYQMSGHEVHLHDGISRFSTNSDTSFISPRGIKANIECRYYFLRRHHSGDRNLGIYAAANFSYRWNQTDIATVYLKDSITPTMDCYWMRRSYWGAMAVVGAEFVVGKLVVDVYAGIGAAERTVFNHNREYNKDLDRIQRNIHGFDSENKFLSEYNGTTVAVNGGIRVGIAF